MKRYICVFLPHWPTDRWRSRRSDPRLPLKGRTLGGRPLVLIMPGPGGPRVTAVDALAAGEGLHPGQRLADARALVPHLHAVDADPAADREALGRLADWCCRYTPWVAVDGEDGIMLDITGCAHLFGGEEKLIADLERRVSAFGVPNRTAELPPTLALPLKGGGDKKKSPSPLMGEGRGGGESGKHGITVRAAAADTPAAAWAWVRFGDGPILPLDTARARLAPLPAEALRLPADIVETLRRLGLRRIGDLLDKPRGPLAARFGDILLQRLDRALGHAEPISPRRPAPLWRARIQFADGIGRREDIDAALRQLLDELCRALETDGRGARQIELAFYRLDGTAQFMTIGTSRPARDAKHLARLFTEKLGAVDPGFGIETMILGALATDPLAMRQVDLAPRAGEPEDLAAFVDRLQNRLGAGTVTRLAPVASYVPERAVAMRPATAPPSRDWPKGRSRPIRLLAAPEAIDAVGVPGDPPRRFRWRRVDHHVAEAEGPERLSPEWWRTPANEIRDYYWLQDAEGRRFWVYRLAASDTPAWYLHGLFA